MTASSNRYQSKLFNVVSQSLHQLAKLQPHLRRLKMTAIWSAQVIGFSAYRLLKTTYLGAQQLSQGARQRQLATGATEIDSPAAASQLIQQVLFEAERSLSASPGTIESFTTTQSKQCKIQGIATHVSSRSLVLVTTHQELLDILTPEQQRQLRQRFFWEAEHPKYQGPKPQAQPHFGKRLGAAVGQGGLPLSGALQPLTTWVQSQPLVQGLRRWQRSFLRLKQAPDTVMAPDQPPGVIASLPQRLASSLTRLDRSLVRLEQRALALG
ncbi:MAG TPA: hypothetical protein V6D03_15850, partial [Candidatus Caenarcaniphilales bacterium]